MPIAVTCVCGRPMFAKDEFAGQRARCPSCNAVIEVPNPTRIDTLEVLDAIPVEDNRPVRSRIQSDIPEPYGDRRDEEPEDDIPDLRRRNRRYAQEQRGTFTGAVLGVIGGVLMMAVAVAWFGVALYFDRIA